MTDSTQITAWEIGSDCAGECSDPGSEYCRCFQSGKQTQTTEAQLADRVASCDLCGTKWQTTRQALDDGTSVCLSCGNDSGYLLTIERMEPTHD